MHCLRDFLVENRGKTNKAFERDLTFLSVRGIDRTLNYRVRTVEGMDKRSGRVLRDRRLELGLTQEQVALEVGMSLHQYQRYEYGENKLSNSRMKIGLKICAILELNPFEAVFDADCKSKD